MEPESIYMAFIILAFIKNKFNFHNSIDFIIDFELKKISRNEILAQ